MKAVTVTMEEGVADGACMQAARRNKSVSVLIGEMLAEKMRCNKSHGRAVREALKFTAVPFAGSCLKRDEIYGERLDCFR